jgi:LuxR family maltose regulon positive regulatory protein
VAIAYPDHLGSTAPLVVKPVVRRPRLERLLEDDERRRVTLLCAPPGSGKTTLTATWFAGLEPGRGRWITASDDGAEVVLDAASDCEILVVDDAHHLSGASLALVAELVTDPDRNVDVVLLARADPALPISRLRLDAGIREIRGAALAFTAEEAGTLLCSTGIEVRHSDIARLHERTEGWAAGLRLILCALERGATAGSIAEDETAAQAAVSDYLLAEVLEREPAHVRRFLLRTSVAERLTPELAVLLADDPRGGSILEDLHRRGVFVVALDHGWYRYHSLFASLLRARLRVEDPGLVVELHRWAACWCATRDLPMAAEAHARSGEHWTLVADLVRRRWRAAQLAGDHESRFVEGLPRVALEAEPLLGLLSAFEDRAAIDRNRTWGPALADEVAVLARRRACADGIADDIVAHQCSDRELEPIVDVLDAELALLAGDLRRATELAESVAQRPDGWPTSDALALLTVIDALEGRVRQAIDRLATIEPSAYARRGGRIVSAASAITAALCDLQLGRDPDRATLSTIAETTPSLAMRLCAQTILMTRNVAAGVHVVDPAMSHSPLVDPVLVAIGALDVFDATRSRVSVGGDAESRLRQARYSMSSGSPHAANVDAVEVLADPRAHPRTRVEAAVIVAATSDPQSDQLTAQALTVAEESSIWAPFLIHAAVLLPALERLALSSGPRQSDAIRVLEQVRQRGAHAPVESLTEREATVLRLLPTLMSNDEIAAAMLLSVNTVKTHLKALYRKLGVERRRDAVVRARELDLL